MGSSVVGGVLGGVQFISGIANSGKQTRAAAQQYQAQAQASIDQAKLRQLEIQQSKDYANHQFLMNDLSRKQQLQQQTAQLTMQGMMDALGEASARFQNSTGLLKTQTELTQQAGKTDQAAAAANIEKSRADQSISQQLGQAYGQASGVLDKEGDKLREGDARRATAAAFLNAASGGALGGFSDEQQESADVLGSLGQYAEALLNTQEGVALSSLIADLQNTTSEAERQVKLGDAARALDAITRQGQLAQANYNATEQNISSQLAQNANSRDVANKSLAAASSMAENNDRTNLLLANSGANLQSASTKATLNSQLSGAQSNYSANSGSVGSGLLSLVNSGLNAYNTYRQYSPEALSTQKQALDAKYGYYSQPADASSLLSTLSPPGSLTSINYSSLLGTK